MISIKQMRTQAHPKKHKTPKIPKKTRIKKYRACSACLYTTDSKSWTTSPYRRSTVTKNKEIITTRIFHNGELPEGLKNDLSKKLESRKIQTSNEATEIRNKNSSINFRNRAILLNDIGDKLTKQVEPTDNTAEVCEGIVELDESQQAKLEEIVKCKVPEIGIQLKQTRLTQHKIDVQGHDPIKQRYYHVTPKVREKINEEIDKMLEQGIIEPSCSDWSNSIVMIIKPNGEYRFCLDFRKVNEITKKYLYPIPLMNEILDTLRSAKLFQK